MAVFSLLLLLLVVVAAVLDSLSPWDPDSLAPHLRVLPEAEVGLGDSIAVAPAGSPAVADRRVVGTGSTVSSVPATEPVAIPESVSVADVGISRGRSVHRSRPVSIPVPPPSGPSPSPSPAGSGATLPAPPLEPSPAQPPPVRSLVANFEDGLQGWSTATIGDAVPRVVSGIVRDGEKASVVRLIGDQSSSQLVLGGDGGASDAGVIRIREGDEYAFTFSFYIQTMAYGAPGADNLILRFKSDASDSPAFGLQLWDPGVGGPGGERGLWSSGEAVGGDRFLAPVPEREWHDAVVHFRASSQGAGFYAVYLDGELVDARDAVSLIVPGSSYAQIEVGLYRDGEQVQGTSEIRLDAATLGDTPEPILP